MRVSDTVLRRLVALGMESSPLATARPGQVLYDQASDSPAVLVRSGRVRLVDPSRFFSTNTLAVLAAPYLAGLGSCIDGGIAETLLAAEACEFCSVRLPGEAIAYLLAQAIAPVEIPALATAVSNWLSVNEPGSAALQASSFMDFQEAFRPLMARDGQAMDQPPSHLILYADPVHQAYPYGEVIPRGALYQLLHGGVAHRVAIWQPPSTAPDADLGVSGDLGLTTGAAAAAVAGSASAAIAGAGSAATLSLPDRFSRASTVEESHRSILTILVSFFAVPSRRDLIARAATYVAQSFSSAGIDSYIVVIERLGLEARILQLQLTEIERAPLPFIALNASSEPVFVARSPSRGLCVVNPLREIEAFDPSGFEGPLLRVVQVFKGPHTPEKKFSLQWLLPYINKHKTGLVEVFVASLFTQLLSLASPLLFQQIIDRVIGQGAKDSLAGLGALMVIFAILEVIFGSLRTFQFADISNRIDIEMGSSIIGHMLRLNARYFEKRPVGELASRLNELDNIRRFLTGTALTVTLDALFASLYLVVMFFYSSVLSLVVLGTLPLLLLATVGLSPLTQRLLRQRAEAYAKTQSLMVEILNGIQTIKLQSAESITRQKWEDKHLQTINKGFSTIIANTASSNALQLLNKLSSIAITVGGAVLVLRNEMTLGQLIAFRIISSYVTQPVLRLASAWQGFQEMTLSFERLADVINQPLESPPLERSQLTMPELLGSVCFDNVSFAYSNSAAAQLSGVSLEIEAGAFVGIVGQSGCGKSTLLKLLPRLYLPTQGKVLVDGVDIAKVDLYSFRSQLGYVPQDCLLFEGSVLSNLTYKDSQVEIDEVVTAAKLASAHDFIMSLPYGYSTPIGEKGAGLSGGQRQRIALARMLLQNPRMIILDEATSALDVDTEHQVVTNIRRHARGKTLLMITHRLTTLKNADQIIVMHDGNVDSVGDHDSLMARAGRYSVLYQQQFGGAAG